MLSNRTVTAIREMLATFSRAEIPSLVMEAGGKKERLLSIPTVGDMNSPQYKTKSEILNKAFDSLYSDFDQEAVPRPVANQGARYAEGRCPGGCLHEDPGASYPEHFHTI